ncbi:DUF998 domain-containing protein [Nonomuraea helvata]|uniref:DUF998 domain-containing protein n=1 Tax=Nonomuraea helvata TaxID=37484 RepID=A0ABV5SEH4_9ACTN
MTVTPSATVPRSSVVTARLSSAAILAYQILLLAAIFIKPEVDPTHKPVSEYAIGHHGWVMVLAFLMAALSYGCLLVAVRPLVRGWSGRIGLVILAACVIGTIGVGVFVADPVDTPLSHLTTRGTVHAVSGLAALVLLPFAALLITRDLARTVTGAASVLRWTAWLPLSGLVLHWLVSFVVPPEGWPPRFLFLTYAVWILVLNTQILSTRLRVLRLPA